MQDVGIGQQDIRRSEAQGVLVRDHPFCIHHHTGLLFLLADEKADGDISPEFRVVPYGLRNAPCLVGGQGIHRIDDERLDSFPVPVAVAVVQDGIKKALCFSGACACGDKSGLRRPGTEAHEGFFLVEIGPIIHRYIGKEVWPALSLPEGELYGQVRAFEDALFFCHETLDEAVEEGCRNGEGSLDEVLNTTAYMGSQD